MAYGVPVDYAYAVILLAIAFLSVRWAYRTITGTPVSVAALLGMSVIYVAIFLYAALNSLQTLINLLLLPFLVISVACGVVAARYVERSVRFEVRPDGRWYFRLGLLTPLLYIGILLIRLAENLYLLRIDPLTVQPPPNAPIDSLIVRIVFTSNALLAAGTGFLVGRNYGVRRAYLRERERKSAAPAQPLPA